MTITQQNTVNEIRRVCKEIGANAPLMLAIASLESSLNPNAASKSGTFVGLYQLSNGYGGCTGDQRKNIAAATRCTWSQIQRNKAQWHNDFSNWEDWFAYGMHQQGVAGFKTLYRNRNLKVTELPQARQNAIKTNSPAGLKVVYVSDFLNYWKNRVNGRIAEYTVPDTPTVATNIAHNTTVLKNRTTDFYYDNPLVIKGGVVVLVAGTGYILWNNFFRTATKRKWKILKMK